MNLTDRANLRNIIVSFTEGKEDEELYKTDEATLCDYVSERAGSKIKFEDLKSLSIAQKGIGARDTIDEPGYLVTQIKWDQQKIDRLNKLLDTRLEDIASYELKELLPRALMLTPKDYQKIGLNEEESQRCVNTGHYILRGFLKEMGVEPDVDEVMEEMQNLPWNLGSFERWAKARFETFGEHRGFTNGIDGLHSAYSQVHEEFSKKNKASITFSKELTKNHTLESPKLVKTIETTGVPLDLGFLSNGNLVVLQSTDDNRLDLVRYTSSCTTTQGLDMGVKFGGFGPIPNYLQGSLSVGSDGLIYLTNTVQKRFDNNLHEVKDDKFEDLVESVREELGVWERGQRIHQMIENNGNFYFLIAPSPEARSLDYSVVQTNEEEILNRLPGVYPASGGIQGTEWDSNPRLQFHGDQGYLKVSGAITTIGKDLDKESMIPILTHDTLDQVCIPSNHCISPGGFLYVVDSLQEEPHQTIKGYKDGELVTHFAPESAFPFANLRNMAISNQGKLAYTNPDAKRIDIYELRE